MGLAFVLLGVALLLVEVFKIDLGYIILSWWPIIFILLGIEMLVYLFKRKEDQVSIKFDFLSILFVGIIGTVGIGLTIVSQLGLVDMVKESIHSEYRVEDLPPHTQSLDGIKKVVVDTNNYHVNFYSSNANSLEVFGTIEGNWGKEEMIDEPNDYIVTRQSGDILFVTLKSIYSTNHFTGGVYDRQLTIVIPSDIKMEAIGDYNNRITVSADILNNHWVVQNMREIAIPTISDFYLTTKNVDELVFNGELKDSTVNQKLGSGEYGITIQNSSRVNVQ